MKVPNWIKFIELKYYIKELDNGRNFQENFWLKESLRCFILLKIEWTIEEYSLKLSIKIKVAIYWKLAFEICSNFYTE